MGISVAGNSAFSKRSLQVAGCGGSAAHASTCPTSVRLAPARASHPAHPASAPSRVPRLARSASACRPTSVRLPRPALALLFALAFAACALLLVAGAPDRAFARSYTMPKVDITAEVQTDGSLHVVESRTFEFDGDYTAVWWTFEGLPGNAELQVNGVRLTTPQTAENGEAPIDLSSVPFRSAWRDSGGPGEDAYSVDEVWDTVYVFFDASDETLVVTLDYTVVNGVQAFKDVAEVYWKYVGDQWEEASSDVSLALTLPVPQGEQVVPGENVRAWGHGPLDGTVTVNADGTVSYEVPRVRAGQYAEARVVFPVAWLSNLPSGDARAHRDELRLETVLAEEETWADQANRQRTLSLGFVIACGVACVALLAWALRTYFKHGKEHAPDFTGDYWRDVPDPSVPPAVIGRLWRWDRESADDFTATLMHLAHVGALRIDKGSYPDPEGDMVDDYYLTLQPAVANALTDPIDRATVDLLFRDIAEGRGSLWFGSIQKYGEDHPQEFVDAMDAWQGLVSAETNERDFFELKSKRLQTRMFGAAVVLVVLGIGSFVLLENFIQLVFMVPTAIALGVIANYMPRRTVRGNNLVAKCKALRNWLRDFSSLDERPPTDVKVWGEFMVYAYLFGIAEQVIKELRVRVPELFQDEGASYGMSYVPWWFWYAPGYGASGGVMPSVSDLMQTSVANTVSTAQAALSGASGNFSSGGGFGGGFSGGGGGGFGGGGGAR